MINKSISNETLKRLIIEASKERNKRELEHFAQVIIDSGSNFSIKIIKELIDYRGLDPKWLNKACVAKYVKNTDDQNYIEEQWDSVSEEND